MYYVTVNGGNAVSFGFSIAALEFAQASSRRGNRVTFKFAPQ